MKIRIVFSVAVILSLVYAFGCFTVDADFGLLEVGLAAPDAGNTNNGERMGLDVLGSSDSSPSDVIPAKSSAAVISAIEDLLASWDDALVTRGSQTMLNHHDADGKLTETITTRETTTTSGGETERTITKTSQLRFGDVSLLMGGATISETKNLDTGKTQRSVYIPVEGPRSRPTARLAIHCVDGKWFGTLEKNMTYDDDGEVASTDFAEAKEIDQAQAEKMARAVGDEALDVFNYALTW